MVLQACAPVIADSMREIENLEESDDFSISDLCLDFTFMGLGNIEIELVPGGADREVLTPEDRDEFCALAKVADMLAQQLTDCWDYVKQAACMAQFDDQVALIRSGLDDYQIPSVALLLWTPQEFQEKVPFCSLCTRVLPSANLALAKHTTFACSGVDCLAGLFSSYSSLYQPQSCSPCVSLSTHHDSCDQS